MYVTLLSAASGLQTVESCWRRMWSWREGSPLSRQISAADFRFSACKQNSCEARPKTPPDRARFLQLTLSLWHYLLPFICYWLSDKGESLSSSRLCVLWSFYNLALYGKGYFWCIMCDSFTGMSKKLLFFVSGIYVKEKSQKQVEKQFSESTSCSARIWIIILNGADDEKTRLISVFKPLPVVVSVLNIVCRLMVRQGNIKVC